MNVKNKKKKHFYNDKTFGNYTFMFIYHVILVVQVHQYNVLIYQLIYKKYNHLLSIRFAIVSYMYQNHAVLQCYIVCQYIKHVQNKAIIVPDTLDDIDLGV